MRLNALILAGIAALVAFSTSAQTNGHAAPDPMFGEDPHAKAVLDCHADYAKRFARALTPVKGTPTEVATAAYAHCAAQFRAFAQAAQTSAETSKDPGAFMDPDRYRMEQVTALREYAFAYTLDLYLRQTTTF